MSTHESEEKPILVRKGLLDVLLALNGGRKTFAELKEVIRTSPTTILRRLRELQDRAWVDQGLSPVRGRKPRIDYVLTEDGLRLLKQCSSIVGRYVELREELVGFERAVSKTEDKVKHLLLSNLGPSKEERILDRRVDDTNS